MTESELNAFVRKAEAIYAKQLQEILEPQHKDEIVAIEPDSGDYFLGGTVSEAIASSRRSHPDRLAHAIRIGHHTALHIGNSSK